MRNASAYAGEKRDRHCSLKLGANSLEGRVLDEGADEWKVAFDGLRLVNVSEEDAAARNVVKGAARYPAA